MGRGPHVRGTHREPTAQAWKEPAGWQAVGGIIVPPDYTPSDWELSPAPITSTADALRERKLCSLKNPSGLDRFVFNWCWTVHVDDPSATPKVRRVPAYPYMRDLVAELRQPQNMLTEKSRQMIASWAYVAAFLYDLMFRRDWPMVMMSRRAKEVDDGGANSTIDSLFGKLRFMHARLPPFLWMPLEFMKYKITNPVTGAYITGETGAGGQAGRGPAFMRGLADEGGYIPHGETVFAGLRQACKNGLAINSSPNGRGNFFARIATSKTTTFKRLRLHWSQHPEKNAGLGCVCGWLAAAGPRPDLQFAEHRGQCPRNADPQSGGAKPTSPWYRAQQADLTPEKIASELDVSYDRSSGVTVFDGYDATRHVLEVSEAIGRRSGKPIGSMRADEVPNAYRLRALSELIDPQKPLVVTFDFGVGDEGAMLLGQVDDERTKATHWLDEEVTNNKGWKYYHRIVCSVWYPAYLMACGYTPATLAKWRDANGLDWSEREFTVPDFVDELPPGCLPVYFACDPTGKQRSSDLTSWVQNLRQANPRLPLRYVEFGAAASREIGSVLDWLDILRGVVRTDGLSVSSMCVRMADMLGDWKWPTDKDGQLLPGRNLPEHSKHSHPGTALLYLYRTRWAGQLVERKHDRKHAEVVASLASDKDPGREPVRRRSDGPMEPSAIHGRHSFNNDDDEDDEE